LRIPTWAEIETKIRTDLDLIDTDNFMGQDEFATLGNDAIDAAEAIIMRVREDYFLTSATLSLVNGASNIALPTDMYMQKIRELVYKNGDRIYPLRRLRDPRMFYHKAVVDRTAVSLDEYQYFLKSTTAGAQDELMLTPPAYESGAFLELWYIRHANRIGLQAAPDSVSRATQLATPIDIPEWRSFLEQHIRVRCYEKLGQFDKMKDAEEKLVVIASAMEVSVKDRCEDNENDVPQDISHYMEHN
jgi:hypothetical protein